MWHQIQHMRLSYLNWDRKNVRHVVSYTAEDKMEPFVFVAKTEYKFPHSRYTHAN
jgi:hypothetical protein